MLEVKVIFEIFNLIDIMIKKKSFSNMSLLNDWSKFRQAFFQPKEFRVHIKRH